MYIITNLADYRKQEVYEKLIAQRRRYDDREEQERLMSINWAYFAGAYEETIPSDRYTHRAFHFSESNPVGKDERGVLIYPIASFNQIPKSHFVQPTCSFLLPPFSKEIAYAVGLPARQILLKQEVTRDNIKKHKGLDDRAVLRNSIYHAFYVIYNKPLEKPTYYTAVGYGEYFDIANLDFDSKKRYIEIVDWRHINKMKFSAMLTGTRGCGGFIHLV